MSEPEAIQLFLDNIYDTDYDAWKTAIKLHKDLSLDDHVLQFRERADDINSNRNSKRKLKQHIRRMSSKRSKTGSTYHSDTTESDTDGQYHQYKARRTQRCTQW